MTGDASRVPLNSAATDVALVLGSARAGASIPGLGPSFKFSEPQRANPIADAYTPGPRFITATAGLDRGEIERLSYDPDIGGPRPGEGRAAAQLQRSLGGRLERGGAKGIDARFVEGPYAGTTVNFMLTPDDAYAAENLNKNFRLNLRGFDRQLTKHLGAADLVPMDMRVLSPANQVKLLDLVLKRPFEQQQRIILYR